MLERHAELNSFCLVENNSYAHFFVVELDDTFFLSVQNLLPLKMKMKQYSVCLKWMLQEDRTMDVLISYLSSVPDIQEVLSSYLLNEQMFKGTNSS